MTIVGVGIDLEPVRSFQSRKFAQNRRFYERVFSAGEIAYCRTFRDPAPHFAARFCAKEALVKAARSQIPIHVTDAEIDHREGGAPYFKPRSKKKNVQDFFRRFEAMVSLTHTDDHAAAFVVLVRKMKGK